MNEITTKIIETKLGPMRLRANIDGLTEVEFLDGAGSGKGLRTSKFQERREEGHQGTGLEETYVGAGSKEPLAGVNLNGTIDRSTDEGLAVADLEEEAAGSHLKAPIAGCKNGAHGEGEPDDMLAGYTDNFKINALLNQAETQLNEYFEGRRRVFDLPLAPSGTDFQLRVWAELRKIPYGETRTYGDIASALGKPKASRAVGGANNKNPLSILIPCHRVIGRDGSLVGYASGLDIKEKLLKMEAEGL